MGEGDFNHFRTWEGLTMLDLAPLFNTGHHYIKHHNVCLGLDGREFEISTGNESWCLMGLSRPTAFFN